VARCGLLSVGRALRKRGGVKSPAEESQKVRSPSPVHTIGCTARKTCATGWGYTVPRLSSKLARIATIAWRLSGYRLRAKAARSEAMAGTMANRICRPMIVDGFCTALRASNPVSSIRFRRMRRPL
jgi:hypothetical protein